MASLYVIYYEYFLINMQYSLPPKSQAEKAGELCECY